MTDEIRIRRAETPDDYRACQEAQRLAWGIADPSYLVPVATMVGAQLHGGLVLGAFAPDGRAVGVSFAFLGRIDGRPCLYSQLTGVVPGHQGSGLGRRLKFAQREFCRAEGVPTLAWAFDPFQPGNARFNLTILGATARRYVRDMYGPRTDALNAGAPTDRLIAEWDVDAEPRAMPVDAWRDLPRIVTYPEPDRPYSGLPDGDRVLLEMPLAMPGLRASDPRRAEGWRALLAGALEECFARGFRAVAFVKDPDGVRGYYVLEHAATGASEMGPSSGLPGTQ